MIRSISILVFTIFIFLVEGCSGCSKSGRMSKKKEATTNNSISKERRSPPRPKSEVRIKMEKESGVYKIPITINGTQMYFIFDTGAGMISISNVEATFLYKQGRLTDDDIIGKANFMDANGDISEGTIILLKEVTIGSKTIYNIEASVVDNARAPLLFGQSALEKFGKVSIDYNNNEITFE